MIIESERHLTAVDEENVLYLDEYAHLAEKVRVRRLMHSLAQCSLEHTVIYLPEPKNEL